MFLFLSRMTTNHTSKQALVDMQFNMGNKNFLITIGQSYFKRLIIAIGGQQERKQDREKMFKNLDGNGLIKCL